jgi:outer membrane protein assembly factor BamD (BamD/ComL family)
MKRPTAALALHKKLAAEFPGAISNEQMEAQEYRIALKLARGEERRRLTRPFYSPRKKGLEMLEEMANRGPSSPVGDDAQMALLEYYIESGDSLEAEVAYEKLTQVYPGSELIPLARFQKIKLLLQEFRGPAYDISLLAQAESETERLSRDPRGKAFAQEITQMLKDIGEIRAERDYQTAQFYLRRGKLAAARTYLQAVMQQAPESTWADRAKTQMQVIERP